MSREGHGDSITLHCLLLVTVDCAGGIRYTRSGREPA